LEFGRGVKLFPPVRTVVCCDSTIIDVRGDIDWRTDTTPSNHKMVKSLLPERAESGVSECNETVTFCIIGRSVSAATAE